MTNPITEVIFVGLPGPTHQYGGLSADNVASTINRGSISNPKQAALQALELARLLMSLGVTCAILPPQLRPNLPLLRQHFKGEDDEIIRQAAFAAPALLEKASASSAMWAANAATVAPSVDTSDGKLHISVANLFTNLHRRIEADDTYKVLQAMFDGVPDCVVHAPLSAAMGLRDEGAANHMRLSPTHADKGLHVFVYGADGSARDPEINNTGARQTYSASRAVKQQNALDETNAGFLRQNPDVIRAGVFHNDVIAVSNEQVLLVHELAYEDGINDIERIAGAYEEMHPGKQMTIIVVAEDDLSLDEAVQTYFFNSQIVTKANGRMAMIAPAEVKLLFDGWCADMMERICIDPGNPIEEVHYADLRQSMRNGGGPACLRLRVPMTQGQLAAVRERGGVIADEALLERMERMISAYYPEELTGQDLGNPELYHCCKQVLGALGKIMGLDLLPPP